MYKTMLNELSGLPSDAVFAVISDLNKECYISHTVNLKARIGSIIDDIEIKEDTRLVVLVSGISDIKYKRIFCQYYVDKFILDGYKIVNGWVGKYINYKVRVQYSEALTEALVTLTTNRGDKIVVGSFNTVVNAKRFVKEFYSGVEMVQPIYALNESTRRWCSTNKDI